MAVVADSGALYALYDASDAHHSSVREVVENEPGHIIVPTAILAEVDYLLREYLGVSAELDFLDRFRAARSRWSRLRRTICSAAANSSPSTALSTSAWPMPRSSQRPSDSEFTGS